MDVRDWLCLGGMGAYTYTAKSTFNGMNSGVKIHVCDHDITKNKPVNASEIKSSIQNINVDIISIFKRYNVPLSI